MMNMKALVTLVLLSASTLPAFCDQSQYPAPPQSLINAPSIKGGELGQYSSVYPQQQKQFWGDDAISQSLAKATGNLGDLAKKALPAEKPSLSQTRYEFEKAQAELRAKQLIQAQQAQALHQSAGLYGGSNHN